MCGTVALRTCLGHTVAPGLLNSFAVLLCFHGLIAKGQLASSVLVLWDPSVATVCYIFELR